jgi:hypothetical protein
MARLTSHSPGRGWEAAMRQGSNGRDSTRRSVQQVYNLADIESGWVAQRTDLEGNCSGESETGAVESGLVA